MGADLGVPGGDRLAAQRHGDLAVVVAQVAIGGDRAEVDPLADVGVAEEPVVVLVGGPVDDAGLDLAADAAAGPERHAAAGVGAEQLGVAADGAGALDAGERQHDDAGGDGDRPAGGIEDGVGVDPRRVVEGEPVGGADDGGVAGEVVGVLGDEVPGVRDPFAAEVDASGAGGDRVEPGVDAAPFEGGGAVGPDGGAGGPSVAGADPGGVGGEEVGRGDPAGVGDEQGGAGQPGAVVDGESRVAEAAEGGRVGPDQRPAACRPGRAAEGARELGAEGLGAEPEVEDGTGQGQRPQVGDGLILDEAETHGGHLGKGRSL